jgi:tetratricopeptide (TPR) repeat protein
MKLTVSVLTFLWVFGLPAWAQTLPPGIFPDILPPLEADPDQKPTDDDEDEIERPDYSHLSPAAERKAKLDDLFVRLKEANEADGKLIAEEIWALWLDSGSPSINMILLRGTAFEKNGDAKMARRMYNHVITLQPDYAEGWARSARLAYTQDDLSRALTESAQALILEPREFYALWTMGNVLEKLGRTEEAFEIYQEAVELYPEHPAIKDRVKTLQGQVDGDVL